MQMIRTLLLSTLTCGMAFSAAAENYGFTENIQEANILHCFDWKFTDIQEELPRIAAAGFGAVQVSPVQGNCANSAEWFYAYMPYDFNFKSNGNGSKQQLADLCAEADKYGIKIIVDVVANHVNKSKGNRNSFWNQAGMLRNLGGVNYNSRTSIIHNNLGDYEDVVSENAEVQQRALAFIQDLKGLGVKGIRWDAAKHIGLPSENCDFWSVVCGEAGLWHYGEILDNPGGGNAGNWDVLKEYTDYMSVTDNVFGNLVLNLYKGGNSPTKYANHSLPTSAGHGIDPTKVVYWAESHDTYANDGGKTKNVAQDIIDRAYCFQACRAGETALYFSRPAATERTKIRMGVKGSVNALENPAISAFNRFRVAMNGKAEKVQLVSGKEGHALFARNGGGFAIILPKAEEKDVEYDNPDGYVLPGTYKDEVNGTTFTVTADKIKGHVGANGYAVVIAGETSVQTVGEDEAEVAPVYYTLQGIRVENPVKGLYIKVQGKKATKVVL